MSTLCIKGDIKVDIVNEWSMFHVRRFTPTCTWADEQCFSPTKVTQPRIYDVGYGNATL